jgi:hypothetical protein
MMQRNKRRRRVLAVPSAGEEGLGKSQLKKQVYCYCKWMSASRRFSSKGSISLGRGLRTARGVMGGSGGMVLWRPISMVLCGLYGCGAIDVRAVI